MSAAATEKATVDEALSTLGLSVANRHLMMFLVHTMDEYNDFIARFWAGRSRQLFSIADFHKEKIEKRDLNFEEYLVLQQNGTSPEGIEKSVFEELFMVPIDNFTASVINNKISNDYEIIRKIYEIAKGEIGIGVQRAIRRI